jgi:iron complex transport system permease protein
MAAPTAAPSPAIVRPGARTGVLVLLCAAVLAAVCASLLVGSVSIPLGDAVTALLGGEPARESWRTIVLQFRAPKAATALLAGAALGISGLMLQTLFRNPLADPYILGVSSGASLGAAVVTLTVGGAVGRAFGALGLLGDAALIAASSLGAAAALAVMLIAARRFGHVLMLLILGVLFGYITSALVTLLTQFAAPEQVQRFAQWSFGSFASVSPSQLPVFALVIGAGLLAAAPLMVPLNALLLGETAARALGVGVRGLRAAVVLSAAVLAGVVTAFCGPIGFLGVAVPHLARFALRTPDHRLLYPACALIGALIALLADLIAQVPGSTLVLPLNAVLALFGAPIVVAVLVRGAGARRIAA